MTVPSVLTVTDLAIAARCPRQLILRRSGFRAMLRGESSSSIGVTAHSLLAELIEKSHLHAQEIGASADRVTASALGRFLYSLVFPSLFQHLVVLSSRHSVGELHRLDGVVRSLAALLAQLLSRARQQGVPPEHVVKQVLIATEYELKMQIDGALICGRLDLVCADLKTGTHWLFDLKTFPAKNDPASDAQVGWYALAWNAPVAPAILHVLGDSIETIVAPQLDLTQAKAELSRVSSWLSGAVSPPATSLSFLCDLCTVRPQCLLKWGPLPHAEPAKDVACPSSGKKTSKKKLAISTIVDARKAKLWLGETEDHSRISLPATQLDRHMAIFGGTGSGKTWLAKVVIEEMALSGVPCVVFDVQGDLVQLLKPRKGLSGSLLDRQKKWSEQVSVRVWTPASDVGRRVIAHPLAMPSVKLPEDKLAMFADSTARGLLHGITIPKRWERYAIDAVSSHLVLASKRGRFLTLANLAELIEQTEESGLREPERKELVRAIRSLSTGASRFLYEVGDNVCVDDLVQTTPDGKTPVTVIYLNTLADDPQKQRFVASILSRIYGWMIGSPSRSIGPRLLMMFDEVGPYMPPVRSTPAKPWLKRIFQEGRKYGVCGLFCTQSFSNVDYHVLAQANTLAVGKLNTVQDKRILRDTLSGVPKEVLARIGSVEHSLLLHNSDLWDHHPNLFRPRMLLTEHSSPPWGESEISLAIGFQEGRAR